MDSVCDTLVKDGNNPRTQKKEESKILRCKCDDDDDDGEVCDYCTLLGKKKQNTNEEGVVNMCEECRKCSKDPRNDLSYCSICNSITCETCFLTIHERFTLRDHKRLDPKSKVGDCDVHKMKKAYVCVSCSTQMCANCGFDTSHTCVHPRVLSIEDYIKHTQHVVEGRIPKIKNDLDKAKQIHENAVAKIKRTRENWESLETVVDGHLAIRRRMMIESAEEYYKRISLELNSIETLCSTNCNGLEEFLKLITDEEASKNLDVKRMNYVQEEHKKLSKRIEETFIDLSGFKDLISTPTDFYIDNISKSDFNEKRFSFSGSTKPPAFSFDALFERASKRILEDDKSKRKIPVLDKNSWICSVCDRSNRWNHMFCDRRGCHGRIIDNKSPWTCSRCNTYNTSDRLACSNGVCNGTKKESIDRKIRLRSPRDSDDEEDGDEEEEMKEVD